MELFSLQRNEYPRDRTRGSEDMTKNELNLDRAPVLRPKLQFRLRSLLVTLVFVSVGLGAWFGWVNPRLEFAQLRQRTIARLKWSGKDAVAEERTNQIRNLLEQADYATLSMPQLAYVAIRRSAGVLVIDWVGLDRETNVQGVEITGEKKVPLPIDSEHLEHPGGTLLFTSVCKVDDAETWPGLKVPSRYQACLIISGNRRSNRIDVRFID